MTVGDYLIAINGKPVKTGDNYWEMLNHRLNRKVEVSFNNKPSEEGAWKSRSNRSTRGLTPQVRYERWAERSPGACGQAVKRPHWLPAHSIDESTFVAPV